MKYTKIPLVVLAVFTLFSCIFFSCRKKEDQGIKDQQELEKPLSEIAYTAINWDSPSTHFNDKSGVLTLPLDSTPPRVNSTFVFPDSQRNPIKVVKSVKKADKSYVVSTEDGTLEDLFINTSFTLTTIPQNMTKTLLGNTENIIMPSSVKVISSPNIKSSSDIKDLLNLNLSKTDLPEFPSPITVNEFDLDLGIQLALTFEFGEQIKNNCKRGKINHIDVKLLSALEMTTAYNVLKKISYSPTVPFAIFLFTFPVGPVIVPITIEPGFSWSFSIDGNIEEIRTNNYIDANLRGTVGFSWYRDEDFSPYVDLDRSCVYNLDCVVPGAAKITNEMWPNINVPVKIWERFSLFSIGYGPAFIREYSNYINEYGNTSKSFTDKEETRLGFDILGADLFGDISFTLVHHDITWRSDTTFASPTSIKLQSVSKKTLEENEVAEVSFLVEGLRNGINVEPAEGALVKFITENGSVSREFSNSDENGHVIVGFSLQENAKYGTLSAKLINGEGRVIDEYNDIEFFAPKSDDFDDNNYTPTEEDCVLYYRRVQQPEPEIDSRFYPSFLDEGNTFCERLILEHKEFKSSSCPKGEIEGTVLFDGPILKIEDYAFYILLIRQWDPTYIRIPNSCREIGAMAFYIQHQLVGELIIPDQVRTIGGLAFAGTGYQSITFGNHLESIGLNAFSDMNSLTHISPFPNSLRSIGGFAFSGSAIKGEIVLPNYLEELGANAFENCINITGSVKIPYSVQTLYPFVFKGCVNLNTIYVPLKFKDDKRFEEWGGIDVFLRGSNCSANVIYY